MKQIRKNWFLGLLAIMALLFAGMVFASANPHPSKSDLRAKSAAVKPAKIVAAQKMVAAQRAKMHDQFSKNCSVPKTEGLPFWDYPNMFSGGTTWVGTNGKAVIFNNGFNLSFADATDVAHPTLADARWMDGVYKGVFVDNIAYLLESNAVDVWDVSDPANPSNLNWFWDCTYTGSYVDLAVKDNYAYLAAGSSGGGFSIMDLNTGSVTWPTFAMNNYIQVLISGNYLLAYDSAVGIDVFEIATSPSCGGDTTFPELTLKQSVVFTGYDQIIYSAPYLYAFTYSNSATSQLDVYSWLSVTTGSPTVPVNPAFILATPDTGNPIETISHAVKDGDYLYISGIYGAHVVDVRNAAAPSLYKFFPDNKLAGGNGHQNNIPKWIDSAGGVHILADNAGITSFDLTPARVGYYIATSELWGWWGKDNFVASPDGSQFLANADYEGVVLLDSGLNRTGFWELPVYNSYAWHSNFSLDGTKAYVAWEDDTSSLGDAGASGVAILDISTGTPTLIKNFVADPLTKNWVPFYVVPVKIGTKNYILTCEYEWSSGGGANRMQLTDVTDPTYPISVSFPIASYPIGQWLEKPAIAQGYTSGKVFAVVPMDTTGIVTVDITDPAKPAGPAAFPSVPAAVTPGGVVINCGGNPVLEIAVSNSGNHWFGFAAVLDAAHGLYVIDLANPASAVDSIVKGYGDQAELYWCVNLVPGGSPKPQVVTTMYYDWYYALYDASSTVTPVALDWRYDYGAVFGYVTLNTQPVPNGDNSFLISSSAVGVTPWGNFPDYTKPVITGGSVLPSPPGGFIKAPVKLQATGVTDDVAVTKVRFYAENCLGLNDIKIGDVLAPTTTGGTTYELSFDPNASQLAGLYEIFAVAYDAGYNSYWYSLGWYTIVPMPTVNITAPAVDPCGLVGMQYVKGTAYTAAGFITRVEVFIDGVSLGLADADVLCAGDTIPSAAGPVTIHWSKAWDTTTANDGPHEITVDVLVQDTIPMATNWSTFKLSDPYTVSTANDGPGVFVTSPAAGDLATGTTIDLAVNLLTPDECIKKVEYYLDSASTPFKTATVAPWTATWDTANVPVGNHILYAMAYDMHSIAGTSPVVNLKIVPPTALAVTVTAVPASGPTPLATVLTATVTGGLSPYTYAWDLGDTTSATTATVNHTYTTAGTFTAKVTVTDNGGATATGQVVVTATGASFTVTIAAVPPTGDAPLATVLTATAVGGTEPYTYAWTLGDTTSATTATVNHTYTTAGTYTVTVTVTDSSATPATCTNTLDVVVTAPLAVTATATPATGYAPLATVLDCTATGGTGPYTYDWTLGDGAANATTKSVNHTYAAGTYAAVVKVTDAVGATKEATVNITVTYWAQITNVKKVTDPFRLKVYGTGFKDGCEVYIGEKKVPTTTYKGATLIVAKKGATLKALCPKGVEVLITVRYQGAISNVWKYTR